LIQSLAWMQLMFVGSSNIPPSRLPVMILMYIVLIRLKHHFYLRIKTMWPACGLNVLESQDLQAKACFNALHTYTIQKYFNVKQYCFTLHVLTMQSHYQEKVAFCFGNNSIKSLSLVWNFDRHHMNQPWHITRAYAYCSLLILYTNSVT